MNRISQKTHATSPRLTSIKTRAATFRRDDDGSLIIFSLYIFLIMIMIGGTAVELMRFEAERKHLQNTIDSAVLTASDLKQRADSEAVVRSFFEKSGRDPNSVTVSVETDTLNNGEIIARTVSASSTLKMDTLMMRLAGVNELETQSLGRANERIQNVEISLVLDISGSMRWGMNNSFATPNRIGELRKAVRQFVDVVLQVECDSAGNCVQSPNTDSTTINVIPYAGHVNPGRALFDEMNGNRWHEWSSCIEVTDGDFLNTGLPADSNHQLPHYMKWSIDVGTMDWGWCPKDTASILVAENNAQTIKDYITNIRLHDGTATHVGMKYGVALLDPSSRTTFAQLAVDDVIADAYASRPASYDDEVVKYVVLMTDGQTTDQFRPNDFDYAAIYDDTHSDHAAMMDRYGSVDSTGAANAPEDVETGYNAGTKYVESSITHSRTQNRNNLQAMCNLAKAPVYGLDAGGNVIELKPDRITVFTIAFLAPENARTDMANCASTPSHYYDVRALDDDDHGLDVGTAFTSIARTINQLRLTN